MSPREVVPPQGALEPPGPPIPPVRTCESCGARDLTTYLPNYQHGGRRVCARCLGAFDRLRQRELSGGGGG
jgi:hypothetical protein